MFCSCTNFEEAWFFGFFLSAQEETFSKVIHHQAKMTEWNLFWHFSAILAVFAVRGGCCFGKGTEHRILNKWMIKHFSSPLFNHPPFQASLIEVGKFCCNAVMEGCTGTVDLWFSQRQFTVKILFSLKPPPPFINRRLTVRTHSFGCVFKASLFFSLSRLLLQFLWWEKQRETWFFLPKQREEEEGCAALGKRRFIVYYYKQRQKGGDSRSLPLESERGWVRLVRLKSQSPPYISGILFSDKNVFPPKLTIRIGTYLCT